MSAPPRWRSRNLCRPAWPARPASSRTTRHSTSITPPPFRGSFPQAWYNPPGVIAVRILVIEDEVKVASFIQRALEEESYAVDVCADGAKGLELAGTACYDLVILDLMLPGLPGLEVTKMLHRYQVTVTDLILTAHSQTNQNGKGLVADH